MFVLPNFRGIGIAEKIVQHLLDQHPNYPNIYCIPFPHLSDFYQKFGFDTCLPSQFEQVPEEIIKKHAWCNAEYDKPMLLFILHRR
jgi:predicted GNAT family N-acyltransferase